MRLDGRQRDDKRQVTIETQVLAHPEGSVLITSGKTKILCTAMTDEKVPPFLKGSGQGWVSAEYAMLPGATPTRKIRDSVRGKIDGRSQEIQRLIGRSLRTSIDLNALGERTIWIDCDVVQADGGTRTAAITGGWVALYMACEKLVADKVLDENPMRGQVAAISVGVVEDDVMLDLCYEEDSKADVDLNLIMDERKHIIEVQGTGENRSFTKEELDKMLFYGMKGIAELMETQREAISQNDDVTLLIDK